MGETKPSDRFEVHSVYNQSGTRLALTSIPARDRLNGSLTAAVPVMLAHGTFSNHRSCQGLALYLAQAGFDCWLLDFQGHGGSEKPGIAPTFESMCLEDTAAVLDYLRTRYPNQAVHWVGHSGGGLSILMYLCRHPEHQESIASVVTLASQATHAAVAHKNRYAIIASALITRALGVAPGRWLKIGPENEFASVMLQWYRWSLIGRWLGTDGFDYEDALEHVKCPLLALAGTADTFIAPMEGCEHLFNCYGSADKEFKLCGLATGYKEDYTHARLISSSSAAREVWPMVSAWLERCSSH